MIDWNWLESPFKFLERVVMVFARISLLAFALLPVFGLQSLAQQPVTATEMLKRYAIEKESVWEDDDVATFFYQGEANEVVVSVGGERLPLQRLADSDVWRTTKAFENLAAGVFTYTFFVTHQDGETEEIGKPGFHWRGSAAPPSVEFANSLTGEIKHVELESEHLGSKRKVSVYLPPGRAESTDPMPVVYMADGRSMESFAQVLEPLILTGQLPKTVIVGVHSGGYLGEFLPDFSDYDSAKDLRAAEYLPALESEHFPKHEAFFCEEVSSWAEREWGVSQQRAQRAIFGFSNGGRFAATMGIRHPEMFGHVFAFSVAYGVAPVLGSNSEFQADYYLAAGTWEPSFHELTLECRCAFEKAGCQVTFSSRVSDHDNLMWREEFAGALILAFGRDRQAASR